jgi:hypothetical protein
MNPTASNLARGYAAGELDLLAVLETVIARHPRVLKNGLPNLAFFRAANGALSQPDDEASGVGFSQIEFWIALARQLGLVHDHNSKLESTTEADRFFALPMAERRDRLREAWVNAHDFNEFAVTPTLELPGLRKERTVDVGSDVPGASTLMHARRAVIEQTALIKQETSLAAFIRQVHDADVNLFINHDEDGTWRNVYYRGIRERGAREDFERPGNWQNVEGAVIAMMCDLPLSRLGWIEFDPRAQTLRPCTDEPDTPAFEIVVQPNFEIVALGDRPDPATLWKLARFTTPQPEGRVRKYVLERKPFADALGRGASASELTTLLAGLSRSPLPQNVQFSLKDWGALSERIKIWPNALFIEAEGVEDLSKLLPAGLKDDLGTEQVGDTHLVCVAPNPAALRNVLPPRRTALDYSRRLPPVIEPGDGAALRAPREDLHLRARQLLSLVSRNLGTDIYELDEETVRESAAELGAEALLQRVRDGLSRPLSPTVALALRTWSGEFEAPVAGAMEMLLADNPEQADLIEELPDVRGWIEKKLSRGVYLLRTGGSEQVREALKKIGLETTERRRK